MGFLAPSPPAAPVIPPAPPPVFAGGPAQGMKPSPKIQQATSILGAQRATAANLATPSLTGVNPANTGRNSLLGT